VMNSSCMYLCSIIFMCVDFYFDSLCGLVVGVLGYRSRGPGSILGTTIISDGTGSTQPRE
jgi:hypothetical protein